MLRFRKTCWEIVNNASIKKEIKILRKYSGNINYKAEGLSYVLTIYVFNPNEISDIEMNSLMYSSIFNKVTDKKQWDIINNDVINNQSLLEEKVVNI